MRENWKYFEPTQNTPYLTFGRKLWGVYLNLIYHYHSYKYQGTYIFLK